MINDIGPFIPATALVRIAGYIGKPYAVADMAQFEADLRRTMVTFGKLTDEDWKHLAAHGARTLPDGRLTYGYDPAIAVAFSAALNDVDLWAMWDLVKAPTLVLHGVNSDILSSATAQEMTKRGPKASLVEIAETGHAPMLMDPQQISMIANFLK